MADEDDVDILGEFSINSYFPNFVDDSESRRFLLDNSSHENIQQNITNSILASQQNKTVNSIRLGEIVDPGESPPNFIREEILSDQSPPSTLGGAASLVTTAKPTIVTVERKNKKKKTKPRPSSVKPSIIENMVKAKVISNNYGNDILFCEDDLLIGSTESIGDEESDGVDPEVTIMPKLQKKPGNHRRKHTLSDSSSGSKGGQSQSKFNISVSIKKRKVGKMKKGKGKTPEKKKDNDVDSSPKLQIVFSSGQSLPVSEGEQVIKILKEKETESESDVDIDVGSGEEVPRQPSARVSRTDTVEFTTRLVDRKFAPVRPRQKKLKLMGEGGCTIMHTDSGDLVEVVPEPRRERAPRPPPVHLFYCKPFPPENPAQFDVSLCVSALVLMECHAAGSRAEVMGLLGGATAERTLLLQDYAPAAGAAGATHCEMCPVSQSQAAEELSERGLRVVGWHHSHPRFIAQPSQTDLLTQRALQDAFERRDRPFVALITSQLWAPGRSASHYRCFRVESELGSGGDAGYQYRVRLSPDVTRATRPRLARRLADLARAGAPHGAAVCPDAGVTYLEKCVSSVSHHLTAAGYPQDDLFRAILSDVRDAFR